MPEYTLKYNCGPVSTQFHNDMDSRVKLLIGPFGTGKTTSAAYDLIECYSKRVLPIRGKKRSRFVVVRNCYDDKTEILTEDRGFQFFKDLTAKDKVAVLIDDVLRYKQPERVHSAPYKGEMVGFEGEGADFLVTPDHKMYVSKARTRKKVFGPYGEETAENIYGTHLYRVKRDAAWQGESPCHSEDFFEWMGFWFAEGCAGVYDGNRYQCVITQDPKRFDTEALFVAAGLPYTVADRPDKCKTYRLSVNEETKGLIAELSTLGKSHSKFIPLWVKTAPVKHLKRFIEGYEKGDGHISRKGTRVLFTSSKQFADDLQEIALKAGLVANISSRDRRGEEVKIGQLRGVVNHVEYSVTLLGKKKHRPCLRPAPKKSIQNRGWYKEQYDGMVYCVEMPIIPVYVRRNGKAFWCYRTYPELRDTTIKTYLDWFPPLFFGRYTSNDKIYKISYDDREIEIIFKALDSPQDVRDLLSLELTGAHIDEAREMHHDILKGLLGRIGRYPSMKDTDGVNPFLTPPQVLLTTNYPSSEHWLYKDFVSAKISGYEIYTQGQEENKHNLRPNYYEDMELDYANRPDLLKTLVRGEWGVTVRGKAVYPEFKRDFHVSKHPLKPEYPVEVIRGWDNTGLSPAINLSYVSSTGQWCIFKEFCFEDTGIKDATEAMILWCNQNLPHGCVFVDYSDPAGKNRDATKKSPAIYIAEKFNEYGMDIYLIDGIQTFKIRREAVANRLTKIINGEPALIVDPSCVRLVDGFDGGYSFPEIGNSGTFKTEPAKNEYSHIHDAVQYPATRLFLQYESSNGKPSGPEYDREEDDFIPLPPVGRNKYTGY